MRSHQGWTAFSVIGALGLMTTAQAVESQTGQNLVINGDFESGNCHRHIDRRCSLTELVVGPKSPGWNIGKLKYDPARDPNYRYTITITGTGWVASANPQRAGLGGFFVDGTFHLTADIYYNAKGHATAKDRQLGEIAIEGESFQVQ